MRQHPQQSGRPGSALLILGAIFATALLLRVPVRPAHHVERVADLGATPLAFWSSLPVTSMERPSYRSLPSRPKPLSTSALELEPIQAVVAVQQETSLPGSAIAVPAPAIAVEPALVARAHGYMSGLAAPVAPGSIAYEDSGSGPFGVVGGAVGTAFVKTGAAISLAFKKTGQGILAPF